MSQKPLPLASIIACVILLVCAFFVVTGDRHLRDATVVLSDGAVIRNAQMDWQPLSNDIRITQAQDSLTRLVPANSVHAFSWQPNNFYLGPWAWTGCVVALVVLVLLALSVLGRMKKHT
jgi:hypothetical protein